MSVDDHGLETLKKAAEEITPGSKAEYQYRVRTTASALPSGAATEAKQDDIIQEIQALGTGGTALTIIYNAVSAVASASTVDILSYTVPLGKKYKFLQADAGGENIATYRVKIDAVTNDTKRTYFGGPFWITSKQAGIDHAAGTVLSVEVENFRPTSADFEARLLGVLSDA